MRRTPLVDGWSFRPKVSRFAELAGEGVAEWEPVTLPHDAVIATERSSDAGPATGYFRGGSWAYRRELQGATADEPVVVLELEGAYRDAVVTVNGSVAGRRPYGYSRFFVRLDPLLEDRADNEVAVEVRAGEDSRWYSGAGLHRPVWLHRSGLLHLVPDGLAVTTPEVDEGGAVVEVAVEVANLGATTMVPEVRVELFDPDGSVVSEVATPVTAFPGDGRAVRQRLFVVEPQRWGPDHPHLHTCRARLVQDGTTVDEVTTTFGIRSLALDPQRGLRINGERILLRGACVHHDNGPLGAATLDRAEERRVELLKAAGFNALRSAHNPMSRAMLDACDRLGVVVMDEAFDMWGEAKSGDDYARRGDDWWERDVEAMVRADRNHPSVVFYSIGNEIPDGSTPAGLARARDLAEAVRRLDPSRYVTQAVTGFFVAGPALFEEIGNRLAGEGPDEETGVNTALSKLPEVMREVMATDLVDDRTREAFGLLDAAGYNYMEIRFAVDAERHPNRVIIGSETHPAEIDRGWAAVRRFPQVIGDFTWTGWDYLGEAGIGQIAYGEPGGEAPMLSFHGAFPWVAAGCGDLDLRGVRRPQSYYREVVFGLRADPYLAVRRPEHSGLVPTHVSPWSWTDAVASWSWAGHEGTPMAVEVYAAADEVELLLDGRSLGRQPAGPEHRFRAEFELPWEPGVLEAVAWSGGVEQGRTALRSSDGPIGLGVAPDRTDLRADTTDAAFVTVTLEDASGVVDVGADRPVTVEVEGPAVLAGVAGGNPITEEPFTGPTVSTHDGQALAVVRPTGAGAITVRVSADGCDPAEVSLRAG